MTEEEYDKLLGIETGGFGEWIYQTVHYNRYEATPYEALDKFFEEYQFTEKDRVVDFGCGRGRVAFYIHNHFHIPVTGVEVMEKTYEQAIRNKAAYMKLNQHIKAPIHFHYGAAEDYELEPADNRFYFFNPFSIQVFKEVVGNILGSVRENKRSVDIILYYPMQEYERFLKNSTPFRLIKQIRLPDKEDDYEKFLVYRYS
ncbi:MAG: class I SAM-dependent methyltransferase [Caldicoprobacterales bacterium]|jgi:SAM-dependent methyltransferase|nr:class I SAM-dependent methyltransferase [Clostridiales bacterium]